MGLESSLELLERESQLQFWVNLFFFLDNNKLLAYLTFLYNF